MTALGNNAHVFAQPHRREQLRWCFETVLGCPVAEVGHPGMPEPMLVVRFPGGGNLSVEFTPEAPDDDRPRLGAWLELRVGDPAAVMRTALEAGLPEVTHPGHPFYFLAPGGQVFTIATAAGDAVALERLVQAPPDRVWAALTDPSQAGTWFAGSANIVPEPGGAYELFWQPGNPDHQSTIGCRITAIAPARYLAFTWRGPDELSAIMNEGDPPPPPTHVTITLTPARGGTFLRVRHTGFGQGPGWARARGWHERAWVSCLDNLEAFLAGRPLPRPWNG